MDDGIRVELAGATALFTSRAGGVSTGPYSSLNLGPWTDDDQNAVSENRRRLATGVGRQLALGSQVHGAEVEIWNSGADLARYPRVDAHVTRRRDIALMALVADCLPIAVAADDGVAIIHAGWRGLAGGVIASAVGALRSTASGRIHSAVIGPGAGPCCYEVGEELRQQFSGFAKGRAIDLKAAAAAQLRDADVASVDDVGCCTICDARFFSHRRDAGVTGRQAGVVWLL